jgi:hypothetical protein
MKAAKKQRADKHGWGLAKKIDMEASEIGNGKIIEMRKQGDPAVAKGGVNG